MVSKLRQPEIVVWQKVGIDKQCYAILRKQKKEQEKSMMRIIRDLIIEKYVRQNQLS